MTTMVYVFTVDPDTSQKKNTIQMFNLRHISHDLSNVWLDYLDSGNLL